MVLTDEEKKKIKDYMLNRSNINPKTFILPENTKEALEYADFVYNKSLNALIIQQLEHGYA